MLIKTVSIIIPAYNEAKMLDECVVKLCNFLHQFYEDYEIIIAEDGCTDGTDVVAKEIAENNGHVIHLHYDEKLGRGGALKRAFKRARAKEVLVYMDVDLATDLSVLPSLIETVEQRKGMATASRHLPESKVERTILRKITSQLYNWLIRILFRDGVHDHQCGCKVFHRDLILDLLDEVEPDGWFWDTEMIVRAKLKGYSVIEIPCIWREPSKRKSKVNVFHDAISMGISAIKLFRALKMTNVLKCPKCGDELPLREDTVYSYVYVCQYCGIIVLDIKLKCEK